jgi:hypothetical protein
VARYRQLRNDRIIGVRSRPARELTTLTTFPDPPDIPSRPAVYGQDSDDIALAVTEVKDELGWPDPAVYADTGADDQPRTELARLVAAIAAGEHDGVFVGHPLLLGDDLDQIEAFDRLCREHGVLLQLRWFSALTDTRALFDVVHDAMEFTVTEDHLRLLQRGYVWWDETEFGAPQIDPKRPYGNSDVLDDIAEILDVPEDDWRAGEEGNPTVDAEWRFLRIHVETAIALQIALVTGEFRAGRYVRDDEYDDRSWRPA